MNTREVAAQYRLSFWSEALRERSTSGVSIREFCQNRGVSRNTYFYWQRKLRELAVEQIADKKQTVSSELSVRKSEEALQTHSSGLPKAVVPSGWSQVSVVEEVHDTVGSVLSIEINGCRVTVDENTSPELLSRTCRTLISLC